MSLKKPDGEKFERVTISMSPALYKRIRVRLEETGSGMTELLTPFIEAGLSGEPIPAKKGIHASDYTGMSVMISDLQGQVRFLTEEMEKLKNTSKTQIQSVLSVEPSAVIPLIPVREVAQVVSKPTGTVQPDELIRLAKGIRTFYESNGLNRAKFKAKYPEAPDISKVAQWEKGFGSMSRGNYNQICEIVGISP